MTDRELLQQALDALEVSTDWDMNATGKQAQSIKVINAIRARLAQPKPEPVAWWDAKLGVFDEKHFDQLQPLYTAPPQREWQGLTDEEMLMVYGQNHEGIKYSLGRMVQAKLKEKNT